MNKNIEQNIIDLFRQFNFSDDDIGYLKQELRTPLFGFLITSNGNNELLNRLNKLVNNDLRNITKLNPTLEAYNSDCYSLDNVKSIILKSLNNLIERYPQNSIPIIYTTEAMPNGYNCPSDIWKELCSLKPFELKDYGHLNFIDALLALEKEKIIAIKSFFVQYLGDTNFSCKVIVDYKKIIKDKATNTTKRKMEPNRFIYQDESGIFYCYGEKIIFKSHRTFHYMLFEYLFDNSNNLCSYGDIINYFRNNGKRKVTKKSIPNAINQLFYRVKVNKKPLPKLLRDKKTELIETIWGDGLKLNNPIIS